MINKMSDSQEYEGLVVYHFNTELDQGYTLDIKTINNYMKNAPILKGCANVAIVGDMEVELIERNL